MPRASLSVTPSRAFPGGRRGMTGCGCVGAVCRTAAQVVPSVRSRPVSIVSCNRERRRSSSSLMSCRISAKARCTLSTRAVSSSPSGTEARTAGHSTIPSTKAWLKTS